MSDGVPTIPFGKDAVEYAPTFGRFEARGMLGRGGMGLVLRAYDPKLGRDVALKLIAPERWEAATIGKQRLELEARALAQLSHPNVVTVYDMGTLGEQPFIAMELVDGLTLRSWISLRPRDEQELVTMFSACARGLAAAHAAGLVHRDFKPDNVLIGSDGRPRVTDFGLVASSDATSIKGVEGTPAYMAPEQWLNTAVDARTDQFSFCVALWEALTGKRPFAADDDQQLRDAVLAGTLRSEPRPRRAIAAILVRGLAREPADRWPSLDELLAALDRARPRSHRWWIAGGLAIVAAGGLAAFLLSGDTEDSCASRARRIDEAWHPIARLRLTSAFEAVSPQTGKHVASYVTDTLDRYATTWATAERAVCNAPPSPITDRRADCLEEANASFARVVNVLATANSAVVDRSSAAVDNLPEIAACEDAVALSATSPPPSDPAVRARIADILRGIDEAYGLELRGQPTQALALIKPLVAAARELGHARSIALTLEQQGDLERELGDLPAAELSYRAGANAAADARHDRLAAKMWSNLLFVGAEQGGDLTRIVALEPVADAAVRRAGSPPHLRFLYLMGAGVLAAWREDLTTARTRFAAAAELMKNTPRRRSEALVNLTIATSESEGVHAALPLAKEAAQVAEQAYGPQHPSTAFAVTFHASLALRVGQLDDAERELQRALSIFERAFGRRSAKTAHVLQLLGVAAGHRDDLARARTLFDEAISIQRETTSEYDLGIATAALASTLLDANLATEALPHYERALALFDKSIPNSTEGHTFAVQYARALAEAGRCADARPILDRAESVLGKAPHLYVELLAARGVCEADNAVLERAVAYCTTHPCDLLTAARGRLELAKRLPDRARARSLAAEAHDALSKAGVRTPIVAALAELRDRR